MKIISILIFLKIIFAQSSVEFFQQGNEKFNSGNYKDAIFYYKKSLEKNQYFVPAFLNIAKCYKNLNDIKNSIDYYEKALKIEPNNVTALNSLGFIYLEIGKNKEAENYFRKTLRISPADYDALIGIGKVNIKYSDFYTAERYFNQALKIAPSENDALLGLAEIYIIKNKFQKADEFLSKAERIKPTDYRVYYLKALINTKKNNLFDAKEYYEKAHSINPSDISTILNLADVYLKLGEWSNAIQMLEKSIKTFQKFPKLYVKLSFAYQMAGSMNKAIENLKKAIELDITDDISIYHYENLLISNSRFYNPDRIEQANKHFKMAEKFAKNNQSYNALYEYRRGLQIFSEDFNARYNIGLIYKKLGFLEKYLDELKIAIKLNPENVYLKDKLEVAETFRNKRLSSKLKIEQDSVPKDKIKILILNFAPESDKYIHLQTGKIIADSINNHLRNFNRFEVYDKNENKYYLPFTRDKIREEAEKTGAQYYLYGNFVEYNDNLELNFTLFSVDSDEPIKSFSSDSSGKDKLFLLSKDVANQLNNFLPIYGRIYDIRDDILILNIGKADGCKKNDKIEIYSSGGIAQEPDFYNFYKIPENKKSTATIIDVDEQIAIAKLDNKYDINKVSINDLVKISSEPKKR